MSVFVYVMWPIKSKDCRFLSSTEVGPVHSLQFRLTVESWGISPQTSTAHSLLIFHSLSLLLNSANYVQAPATAACLIWCCAVWLWCLYQRQRDGYQVLIEERGIIWLPASGGVEHFILISIWLIHIYFRTGTLGHGVVRVLPHLSQGHSF